MTGSWKHRGCGGEIREGFGEIYWGSLIKNKMTKDSWTEYIHHFKCDACKKMWDNREKRLEDFAVWVEEEDGQ